MKKTASHQPGAFLRLRLADGSFGYGRGLGEPYTAFYDHRTTERSSDLETIASKPILFRLAVRRGEAADGWENIGSKALIGEVARPVVQYMQDLADFRRCTVFDSAGMERRVRPEECIGLERAAVWDAHHVEARLLDTFMGRPNEAAERARPRLA